MPLGRPTAGSIIYQQSHQLLSETQHHLCAMLASGCSQPVVEPGRDTQAGLGLGDSGLFSQVTRVQGLPASLSKQHCLTHFHLTFLPSLLHSGSDQHHRLQVCQSLLPSSLFSLMGIYPSRFLTCSIPSWFLLSAFSKDLTKIDEVGKSEEKQCGCPVDNPEAWDSEPVRQMKGIFKKDVLVVVT